MILEVGCDGCTSCTSGSGKPTLNNGVDTGFELGRMAGGVWAGQLAIRAVNPSANDSRPAGLLFDGVEGDEYEGVHVIRIDNKIRQVKAVETLADIVDSNPSDYTYDIVFYATPDGGWGSPSGVYTIPGGTDVVQAWRISSASAPTNFNQLRIAKFDGAIPTESPTPVAVYDYTFTEITADEEWTWELAISDDGVTPVSVECEHWEDIGDDRWRCTREVERDGGIVSEITDTWWTYTWGRELKFRSVATGDAQLVTEYFYREDEGAPEEPGRLWKRQNPDGSWIAYRYEEDGRLKAVIQSWLNECLPADPDIGDGRSVQYLYEDEEEEDAQREPISATERVGNDIVGLTTYDCAYSYGYLETRTERRFPDPDNETQHLQTVTKYYSDGRVEFVLYPDGRRDHYINVDDSVSFSFSVDGGEITPAITDGGTDRIVRIYYATAGSPGGITGVSEQAARVTDATGRLLYEERGVAGISWGSWFMVGPLSQTVYQYDAKTRLEVQYHSDGTKVEHTWGCCAEASITDRTGMERTTDRDVLGRVLSETKAGAASHGDYPAQDPVTTTITRGFDGSDNPTETTVVSDGTLSRTTTRTFDLAGRILAESDDDTGLETTYLHETVAGGGRKVTRTLPGGAGEITEYFRDGRVKSVTGTAIVVQFYEYGVEEQGDSRWPYTKVYTGADDSPRWTKTVYDGLGRVIREDRPGYDTGTISTIHTYLLNGVAGAGQIECITPPHQANTCYRYDALSRLDAVWLDLDDDGSPDFDGVDRITVTEQEYELDGENNWWAVTRTIIYPVNSSDTGVTIAEERRQASGLTVEANAVTQRIPARGDPTITTVALDPADKLVTETTLVPGSAIPAETVTHNGLVQSTTSPTGVTTTFAYDGLGRRTVVTDPRSGPTFTTYNDFGVESVYTTDDGEPNGDVVTETGYGYSETTGRLAWTRNRRENATYVYTRFGYSLRGELEKTWGDVPQPTYVEYDAYGQRTTLRTYRGGSGWDGSGWPGSPGDADETTWTYDPATGLLLTKTYADSTEVNYTYTADGRLFTRTWAREHASSPLVTTYRYYGDSSGFTPPGGYSNANTGELGKVEYSDSTPAVSYGYTRDGLPEAIVDAAGTRVLTYDAETREPIGENLPNGFYGAGRDIERGYHADVVGRLTTLSIGAEYEAAYDYDDEVSSNATGRLSRVRGPGLPGPTGGSDNGVYYTYHGDSDLVQYARTKTGSGTVQLQTRREYETGRNLLTYIENRWAPAGANTVVSKYAYVNDARSRRTSVVRTGAAFGGTGGSGDHLDLWSYNDRNELTGSNRYADTDPDTPADPVAALDRLYAYDPIGNRTGSEDGVTPTVWAYETNALNQYERIDTVGDALIRQGYSFDADGNLAEQWLIGDATCDGMVNSFDTDWFVAAILDPENNEMPEFYPGDQECWDRRVEWADVDGNGLINSFDVDPFVDVLTSGGAVSRAFTWNAENKLVMAAPVQSPPPFGAQRVKFVYDYMGRRIEKLVETWTDDDPDEWVETSRIRYVYDGWLLLEELDAMDSNAVVRQYTWGLDLAGLNGSINDRTSAGGIGGLLAVHDETVESGEDYIYFYDANGNVSQLVAFEDGYGDATDDGWHMDRLVARYEYDAYGRI
ncbi:MAG: hypothetical protein AB7Q17_14215, partial [Phycisphaerae bacterium]